MIPPMLLLDRSGLPPVPITYITSAQTNDQIITAANLITPNDKFGISMFIKPNHPAGNGANSKVFSFANAGNAGGNIGFQWDHSSDATMRATWFHHYDYLGNMLKAQYPSSFTAGQWAHVGYGRGQELTLTTSDDFNRAYLAGIGVAVGNSGPPTSLTGAIAMFADMFSQISALGAFARLAVWVGRALTQGEWMYLANGGHPLSVGKETRSSLVAYIEGTAPATDAGPSARSLTTTGTTTVALAGLSLMPLALPLGRAGTIYCITHRGGATARETVMYLAESTDGQGTNFYFRPIHSIPPTGHVETDPDAIYFPPHNCWYKGVINTTDGVSTSWDLSRSDNGYDWTFVQSVDCSAIATGGTPETFKPRGLVDGSVLRWYLGCGTSVNDLFIYEQHCTSTSDFAQPFTSPLKITGTGLPNHCYDCQCQKIDGLYYIFVYNQDTDYMDVWSSSSYASGFTRMFTMDRFGFGGQPESACWVHRDDGHIIVYADGGSRLNKVQYVVSSLSGTFADVLANSTWSAPAPIQFHGVDNTDTGGHFVSQGPTMHKGPAPTISTPVPSFTASTVTPDTSTPITLTDTSTNGPTDWHYEASSDGGSTWADLPKGTYNKNPVFTLTTAGTWKVRLTASNSAGTSSPSASTTITVTSIDIVFVSAGTVGDTVTDGSPITKSIDVGSGNNRCIVVEVKGETSDIVPTATFNGVSLTLGTKTSNANGQRWMYLLYLLNPAAGAHNLVVSQSSGFFTASYAVWNNVKQAGQPDAIANPTTSNARNLTANIFTTKERCWAVLAAGGSPGGSTDPVADTGCVRRAVCRYGIGGLFDSNGPLTAGPNVMSIKYNEDSTTGINGCMLALIPG
jgi:PKD repeat protein